MCTPCLLLPAANVQLTSHDYMISLQTKKCGSCKSVQYCSQGCQEEHWYAAHKKECKQLKAEREQKEGAQASKAKK